jgi:hypothetical protein
MLNAFLTFRRAWAMDADASPEILAAMETTAAYREAASGFAKAAHAVTRQWLDAAMHEALCPTAKPKRPKRTA